MSLITSFDPWKNSLCTCPPKYSLSAYTGCGHGCIYCYASSYIRNFSLPREKKEFLKRLNNEIKKLPPGSLIAMANSSDPYLPLEKELKLTRESLKILKGCRINIVTKSSLILRDLDILKDFQNIVVSLSLTTLNENLAKKLDPGAPGPKERLKTMEKLSYYLPVACRFDPLVYPLNTGEIKKIIKTVKTAGIRQIITSTYKIKPDNFKKMLIAFPEHKKIWSELYLKEGENKNRYTYLPTKLRKEIIGEVRQAALDEKLEFSSCREGFENLNTKNCDGSSLF